MANRNRELFCQALGRAEKPLIFSQIVQRIGLHPATVSRLAYELALEGTVEIEKIGIARRVRLIKINPTPSSQRVGRSSVC